MKRFILFTYLLFISSVSFAANLTDSRTIDFGSMGYIRNSSSGFNKITMPASGIPTTSAAGPLTGLTGGSAGSATVETSGIESIFIWIGGSLQFRTNANTNSYTVETPGCGKVSVSNFTTSDDLNEASSRSSPATFPLGAMLTLEEFTGTTGCTISGTISGPVQYRYSTSSWSTMPVTITVYIAPHMSLAHDQNAALDFGNICRSSTQQTITVRPDSTATSTNTLCPLTNTRADSFTATGNIGQSFDVSLPATASISNGSDTLTIDNFTSSCTTNCVLENGAHTFTVGGTLTVPGGSSVGEYTGSYPVSITY